MIFYKIYKISEKCYTHDYNTNKVKLNLELNAIVIKNFVKVIKRYNFNLDSEMLKHLKEVEQYYVK